MKETALIAKIKATYEQLREDEFYDMYNDRELLDHVTAILTATHISGRLTSLDDSLSYLQ